MHGLLAALLEIDPGFLDRWVAYCRTRASCPPIRCSPERQLRAD
jgi:hypothetical protein